MLQHDLRFNRQTDQLTNHEIYSIVGIAFGLYASEIPGPARRIIIEGEQPLFGECVKKLNNEKGVAGSLAMHKLRQRHG